MDKKYIVTNFAYGTGPYQRMIHLALAFNDELESRGKKRLGIIVPLIYGEKQKKVMAEEFGHLAAGQFKNEIILDEKLGKILGSIFYPVRSRASNGVYGSYEQSLAIWGRDYRKASKEAHEHLKKTYGNNISVELARSPRIAYGVAPAYFTSFAYVAEILERAKGVKDIDVRQELLEKGIEAANWVESQYKIHAIAYPATFDYLESRHPRYKTEILTPPIAPPPKPHSTNMNKGIFVTITGIPGLERLYSDAKTLGLNRYSNDTEAVAGSAWALPHIKQKKNTVLQFARAGWSSVWISMISGTPLVVPKFDPKDDPELYFNNLAVEKLGIGVVYRGQPLKEILAKAPSLKANSKKLCDEIIARWGTLDGNAYCAKLFAEDFCSKFI